MFNLFSFALILIVDIILKEELLTHALIMWGLALLGRRLLRSHSESNRKFKAGRSADWHPM